MSVFEESGVCKLSYKYKHQSHVHWNGSTAKIYLPRWHTSRSIIHSDVVHYSPNKLIANVTCVEFGLDEVYKNTTQHIFTLREGRVAHIQQKLSEHPEWTNSIRSMEDLVCNPFNTEMHHILPKKVKPNYQGDFIFIDHYGRCYIKLEGKWVLVDKAWLKIHIHHFPNVQRELFAMKLSGIELL